MFDKESTNQWSDQEAHDDAEGSAAQEGEFVDRIIIRHTLHNSFMEKMA